MPLAPDINIEIDVNVPIEPSKTYKIDWDHYRIIGFIDELDAVNQFIQKALSTERFKFNIYTDAYGREFEYLLEGDFPDDLLSIELERVITEALIYDERITVLRNFSFQFNTKNINISFEVVSIFGNLAIYNTLSRRR